MRRVLVVLGLAALAGAAGALVACNSILGIDSASPEPDAAGSGDDGGSTEADAGEPLTCDHYCTVITQNCTDANQEYLTKDICMSMCPVFELGKGIADSLDDTLGCRIWHANAAAAAPEFHCRHAGPLGGDHCGDACEAFCNLDTTYCSGATSAYDAGFSGCLGVCNPNNGYGYLVADAGDLTLSSGDTLNCRLWHLESAYASPTEATFHCPHTALVSSMCQP
jgi:hypothetical protein